MRTLTAPERPPSAGADRPAARGRWIWTLTGLATTGLLAWPVLVLILNAGNSGQGEFVTAAPVATRTITVTQSVTSLSVNSYGAPIQITAGPVHSITVHEAISYSGPGQASAVTDTVSHGRLTLAAPVCADTGCSVGFTVTVPPSVAVTADSENGGIAVAGVAGANLDSDGGNVQASHIHGPLSISSEDGGITVSDVDSAGGANLDSGGGPVQASHIDGPLTIASEDGDIAVSDVTAPGLNLDSGGGAIQVARVAGPLTIASEDGNVTVNGLTGDLDADTGGGGIAGNITSGRASVQTEDGSAALTFNSGPAYVFIDTGGGPAQLTFDKAPTAVTLNTEDGSATVSVPGGPYLVTADSEDGSQTIDIPTAPTAPRALTVSTEGGPLQIVPR
jgi:Putative adhesin